jgi:hypothetical protein
MGQDLGEGSSPAGHIGCSQLAKADTVADAASADPSRFTRIG